MVSFLSLLEQNQWNDAIWREKFQIFYADKPVSVFVRDKKPVQEIKN